MPDGKFGEPILNVLDFVAVCPQALVIMAFNVTVPFESPVTVTVDPLVALKLATARFETLHVTVFVPKFEMVYDDELPGQKLPLPVIADADGLNVARVIVQLLLGLATPLIYGVTKTVDGKEVPEFGVKLTELIVEVAVPDQPLKLH